MTVILFPARRRLTDQFCGRLLPLSVDLAHRSHAQLEAFPTTLAELPDRLSLVEVCTLALSLATTSIAASSWLAGALTEPAARSAIASLDRKFVDLTDVQDVATHRLGREANKLCTEIEGALPRLMAAMSLPEAS